MNGCAEKVLWLQRKPLTTKVLCQCFRDIKSNWYGHEICYNVDCDRGRTMNKTVCRLNSAIRDLKNSFFSLRGDVSLC